MKAVEVLHLLRVTRPTLSKYVKEGIIRVETMPNGHYNYNDNDVYKFLNGGKNRQVVLYTKGKKSNVNDEINTLSQFCFSRGYSINAVYKETSNTSDYEFDNLLDNIIRGNVDKVIISNPSVLPCNDFAFVKYLFGKFNTELIPMTEVDLKGCE